MKSLAILAALIAPAANVMGGFVSITTTKELKT